MSFLNNSQKKFNFKMIGTEIILLRTRHAMYLVLNIKFLITGFVIMSKIFFFHNCCFSSLAAPFLMVYNSTDHVYYLKQYSELKEEFTEDNLTSFLNDILDGHEQVKLI